MRAAGGPRATVVQDGLGSRLRTCPWALASLVDARAGQGSPQSRPSGARTHPAPCESRKPDDPWWASCSREAWQAWRARDADVAFDAFDVARPSGQPRDSCLPRDPRHALDACSKTRGVTVRGKAPRLRAVCSLGAACFP